MQTPKKKNKAMPRLVQQGHLKTSGRPATTRARALPEPSQKTPRPIALSRKIEELREVLKSVDVDVDKEEVYVEIQKTKRALNEVLDDPLANDFCIDEPWALECRVYDI